MVDFIKNLIRLMILLIKIPAAIVIGLEIIKIIIKELANAL